MNWELFYQLNKAFIDRLGLIGFYVGFTMFSMLVIKIFLNDIKKDYKEDTL
jgi:hypothetical protein